MKKQGILFLTLLFACATSTYAQHVINSIGKISSLTKDWKDQGIFYGKQPQDEILAARTAYTKKFSYGNGLLDIYFGGPFHYMDNKGAWQDINLDIKHTNGNTTFINNENSFVSRFSAQASAGVQMEYKNTLIKFGKNTLVSAGGWIPAASSGTSSKANENILSYSNIYKDISLEYELTTDATLHRMKFDNKNVFNGLSQQQYIQVEETIELPLSAHISDNAGRLSSDRKAQGNLYVIINGDTLYTIHSAHAWDGSFNGSIIELNDNDELPRGVIKVETSVVFLSTGKIKLIASIPVNWLKSPDRIYPIVFDPTVGVGNQSSFSSGYRYPFNTCRQQRISQILFLKSDINAGGINTTGTITQIEFLQNTNNPISNNNVRVKMQEVPWNVMTTSTLTTSGFTNVYGPSTQNYTSGGSNTWRSLSLSTPFSYTNTNNLLVEVSFNNAPNNTSGCTCTNTAPGGHWGWYNAPYAGHRWAYSMSAASPPNGGDCNYNNSPEGNPAYGYFIPATRITINTTGGCVPISFSTQPSSQTVVAPVQAQFSVSVAGTTPTYQWQISTNGGSTWNNVPGGAPYSGITTNQLTINPTAISMNGYRYRCVADNNCTSPALNSSNAVLTVNVAGCTAALTPTASAPIPAAGGSGSFAINVTPNTCSWSATETLSWVTITSPLNGTGDATLNYTAAANTGGVRSGIISVNGQNYTVNQLGAAAPTTYTISGRVIENGSPGMPGVTISTAPSAGTAITDAQGYYTLNVPLTYSGTLTPSLAPYSFTPGSRTVSSSNYSNKDFDAQGVTFTISSSVIPPWQREGDDYNGSITVNISNTTTNAWHVEADVYDASNLHVGNVTFPTATGNTYNFTTASGVGIQLKNLSLNGRTVKYAAVFNANSTIQAYPGQVTLITERKWTKKNVLYFNDNSQQNTIRIPTKYYYNSITTFTFKRVGGTSFTLAGVPVPKEPFALWSYPVSPIDGYVTIPYSLLKDLAPGDFEYTVVNNFILRETEYFDLTKFGIIYKGSNNKVIFSIGGIFNEMDATAKDLLPCIGNCNQDNSFTVLNALKNNGFDVWYVGQGNGNSVSRNGYDVANAILKILTDNPQYAEAGIVCHSKGGLDTRAFLQGYNNNYANNASWSYSPTGPFSKIKRVLFLGTPHEGASLAAVFAGVSALVLNSPGALDLRPNSGILNTINNNALTQSISYLNLAGYKSSINSTITLPPLGTSSWYSHAATDGIVPVKSNNSLGQNFPNNRIFQLYQNSTGIFFAHYELHKQNYLSYIDGYHNNWNCLTPTFPTNLAKIVRFFTAALPFNPTYPYPTCSEPSYNNISIGTYASFVSGAELSYKPFNHPNIYSLGRTNEYGNYSGSFTDLFNQSDTLFITSSGHEPAMIPIDREISLSKKLRVALFKSAPSQKVTYPVLTLVNPQYFTNTPTASLYISANNVSNYSINLHSSETVFVPLTLVGNGATISLDTGLNRIIVCYNGIDTVKLYKEIIFLPDALMTEYADTCNVISSSQFVGANIYSNDQLLGKIISSNQTILVPKGYSEIKFTKSGYRDSIYSLYGGTSTLAIALQPYSYSSVSDSAVFDFHSLYNPLYWKTISVKSLSAFNNVKLSVRQIDDPFTGMSLKPQTRKFVFRRIGSVGEAAYYKTAIALDQIKTPDKDSIYLLSIKGVRYIKYLPNQTGITEYDPEVQKLEFDKLDFTSNDLHSIVLMQKQAPRMKPMDTIWHSGQTLAFPIEMFVQDPDSIKNDVTASSADVKVVVNGNMVYVTAPINFVGTTTFTVTGTHDWLDRTRIYTMKVIPPEVFIPTGFTPNNDGLNDILKPVFMGKLLYCHFTVFNRYGQKVFETTDCLSGWNGRINGVQQNTGTFVYYLTYRFEGTAETEKNKKGVFTLIR